MAPLPDDISPSGVSYADHLRMASYWAGAVRLSDVPSTDVDWLWPSRIPRGHVTLLVSDPGAGKSLLALDIAARVSTGRPWPDDGDKSQDSSDKSQLEKWDAGSRLSTLDSRLPGSVLLLTLEDHINDTVRPRLEALGADCSRILAMSHVPGDDFYHTPHSFALNRDLCRLAALIRALRDCRLVILDPITAFLGDTSDQCNTDVWKLLSSLARLAHNLQFAVLAISHLRKKEGAAIHRAMGSLAFIASARTAWAIAKDPADANTRLLLPLKNNLAPGAKGLAFTIESPEAGRAPIIRWLPDTIDARADAVLAPSRHRGRPDDERRYAINWLRAHLAAGPSPARVVRKDADAHGIGYTTLRRAFRDLRGQAVRHGDLSSGHWKWKLPDEGAQNQGGEFWAPSVSAEENRRPTPNTQHPTPNTQHPTPNT